MWSPGGYAMTRLHWPGLVSGGEGLGWGPGWMQGASSEAPHRACLPACLPANGRCTNHSSSAGEPCTLGRQGGTFGRVEGPRGMTLGCTPPQLPCTSSTACGLPPRADFP